MPELLKAAPPGMEMHLLFDQSVFVSEAIDSVLTRRRHRRRPDRADDPHLPRLVAIDPDRHGLDSAVDSHFDRGVLGARPDDQHDDARRPGAGGRHSRRRFDSRDREHAPSLRGECGIRRRGARRLGRHRPADARLDAGDLQRVRLGFLSARRGALFVHAARHGRRLRDADVLCPVAHADADHHPRSAARGTGAIWGMPPASLAHRFHDAFNAASTAFASAIPTFSSACCDSRVVVPLIALCVIGGAGAS